MDVRCERCKTEYEFDDARITEAGVTVKCTTCGHIFKVKKKALVVTVPVKPEDAIAHDAPPASSAAPSAPSAASAPAAEKPREWKVRQANGNLFTFKELTTLQKWIVERKVSRDDEISLTGESWKRLGNIAELASFFQVVEEAQKAQQLQAMQTQAMLNPMLTPSGGTPLPQIPGNGSAPAPSQTPSSLPTVGSAPTPPAPAPQASPPQPAPVPAASIVPPPAPRERVMNAARTSAPEPRFVAGADDHDEVAAAGQKKSGAGKWLVVLLVLALLGAGGYFGWQQGYLQPYLQPLLAKVLPDQFPPADVQPEQPPATPPEAVQAPPEEQPAEPVVAAVEDAGVQSADAGVTAAVPEAQDAGAAQQVAETPKPPALEVQPAKAVVEKVEPKRNFDYWLAQGDRLREREKFLAALDAYGNAVDLKPDRAEAYAGRGLALLDLGRRPQAEASFQEALKLNPRYAVAVMGLAESYRQMGKKAEAIQFYEKYLEILPNGPEAAVAKSAIARLKE